MRRPAYLRRRPTRTRPHNVAECELFDALTADGWDVFKRGWPDFLAVRNGRVLVIEVKPSPFARLKADQEFVCQLLADHGLDVAVWTPASGYRRIMPSQVEPPG